MAQFFHIEDKGRYSIIHIDDDVDQNNVSELVQFILEDITKHAVGPGSGIILNFHGRYRFDDLFLKEISPLAKVIKENQSFLFSLNATADSVKLVKTLGMDGALRIVASINSALEAMGLPPERPQAKIDVEFVNPFVQAALDTLKVQCSTDAKAGKPFVKAATSAQNIAIAGVLGLTSTAFNGTIALCFTEKVFLAIMGRMLGETYTEITKDMEDGAGELLNIIFGGAKRVLNDKNYAIEKAIPTVVRGKDIAVSHTSSSPTVVLPFETPEGPFYIEIATETKKLT